MPTNHSSDRTVTTVLRQGWRIAVWPVWNHDQRRLRAPLRALLPLVVSFLALAALQPAIRARFTHPLREAVELSGLAVILVVGVLGSARLLDRRPVTEYGLSVDRQWLQSFLVGGAVATVANAGTLAVALAAGWASVTDFAVGSGALPFVPAMVVVFCYVGVAAAWEEFIFRGAMLKNIAEGVDGRLPQWGAVGIAVCLSAIVFTFLHGGKITDASGYGYYLVAGLVLGGVYVLSGDLALPIGFHVWYNFTMTAVFGLGVSQQSPELIALEVVGPAVWIGEEGLAQVGFAIVGGLLLLLYIRWRDGRVGVDDRITQWTPRFGREE